MPPVAYWKHHVAFCRHHEFDHTSDLEPQFKEAFEAFGRDFTQIRGSVSVFHDVTGLLIWVFRMVLS